MTFGRWLRPVVSGLLMITTALPAQKPVSVERASSGDAPEDPGFIAQDISAKWNTREVKKVIRKVADWQVRSAEPRFNQLWVFAPLYEGLLAASEVTGDSTYHDAVLRTADQRFQWRLIDDRFPNADDEAIGRVYLDLYQEKEEAVRLSDTKRVIDRLMARPDDPNRLLWWWSDALFMAPPLLARLYQITGNQAYIDFLNKEWWQTSDALYSPSAHLFFRDQRYLSRREANGAPIFWARGNGWVVGGLVQILERLPKDDPARPRLEAQFRDMMNAVLLTQQSDGLWRSGLLDASSYELPEVSGSAFFTYGMVWGIRANLLPRKKFEPAARRAWKGMVSHIYADGRLGSIQPIDGEPGYFKPSGSFVYGVGGFLLAGAEIERLLDPSAMRS